MKVITFECPEGTSITRILGMLWLMYLQAHGDLDYDEEELRTQYRLDDNEVLIFGQLMGEIAKSAGKVPN